MKHQGVVKVFTIALALVCLFHISFTIRARMVEGNAKSYAEGLANGNDSLQQKYYRQYIDSISGESAYNLLLKEYTYMQVKERELNLGLDLQGGMSVTLEVAQADILKALSNNNGDKRLEAAINKANAEMVNSQEDYITLFLRAMKETAPDAKLATFFANKDNKERITFNSSDEEVEAYLKEEADDAVERSFRIIRSRIDRFGVSQPNIQKLDQSGRILVELPGIKDVERARKLLQSTAQLEFWKTYSAPEAYGFIEQMNKALKNRNALNDTTSAEETPATPESDFFNSGSEGADTNALATNNEDTSDAQPLLGGSDTGAADTAAKSLEDYKRESPLISLMYNDRSTFNLTQEGNFAQSAIVAFIDSRDTSKVFELLNDEELRSFIPGDVVWAWHYQAIEGGGNRFGLYALRAGRDGAAALDGDVITDARSSIGTQGFEVQMYMNTEGANRWKALTAEASSANPKKSIAVVLDGVVYSAPTVQGEIAGGVSQISGGFVQEETKFLANILKSGKLPAPARIVEEAVVGPSLGKQAISSGLFSILAGFASVIVIMALIYSTAGWVANLAVLLNLYFIIGVLASLQAALTLPGIAGIILTMGMAVDANVLINERVKDELQQGKNLRNAITSGYKNALSAILDSNITTLITGFVLLVFGTGPIYGFSVTLIIGILSSLFTAILLTRLIMEWMLKKERNIQFSSKGTANLLRNVNFDFLGKRKMFYGISAIVVLAGLISIFTKGLDFGVDFKGGWSYTIEFDQPVTVSSVRESLAVPLESAPEVKIFGTNNTVKITTDFNIADNSENAAEKVTAAISGGLEPLNNNFRILSETRVGPTIADDIKQSAIWSVLVALVFMFLYILIRFKRWQFATGTVIKLLHDVLVVLGLFSILDGIVPFTLEIDQAFIAAILTVIGYSINDSVVVMDRVREFMNEHRSAKNLRGIINDSLNSTLSRTMITSLTTMGVLLILFIFGGEIIRGFVFAMLTGVIVGSYSSICIGAPLSADMIKEDISKK